MEKTWKIVNECAQQHAIAISSFQAISENDIVLLKFKLGDRLCIRQESCDWFYGCLASKPHVLGIFPKNFVQIYDTNAIGHTDPAVGEIEGLLREWTMVWNQKYDECERRKIAQPLTGYFKNLVYLRNTILANRASIDEIKDLKKTTTDKILQANNLLGLDVIAYDTSTYNRLDSARASTVYLYEELKKNSSVKSLLSGPNPFSTNNELVHDLAANTNLNEEQLGYIHARLQDTVSSRKHSSIMSPRSTQHDSSSSPLNASYKNSISVRSNNNSVYLTSQQQTSNQSITTFCMKLTLENIKTNCINYLTEDNAQLFVNLCIAKELKHSSENNVYLCENGILDLALLKTDITSANNKLAVLFCDLNEKDFKSGYKLCLVVYGVKHTRFNEKGASELPMSRIFVGGVFDLSSNLGNIIDVSAEKRNIQIPMTLSFMEYYESSLLHGKLLQDFFNNINKDSLEQSLKSSSSSKTQKDYLFSLAFKCELIEASYQKVLEQFAYLKTYKLCRKMDFPEVIIPDDYRNDFYVTVLNGEFSKAKNYELLVNLVQIETSKETKIEKPMSLSDDETDSKKIFMHKSIVFSKQDKPRWNEIIKISIPNGKKVEQIKNTYVRFLLRNRYPNGNTKVYGLAYLQITKADGSAIKDIEYAPLSITRIENGDLKVSEHQDSLFMPLKSTSLQQILSQQNMPLAGGSNLNREYLSAKVNVVSTQLTQNAILLKLLSFSTGCEPDETHFNNLKVYLNELFDLKARQSAEIVKFLQPLFEKLIDILLDLNLKHTKPLNDDILAKHKHEIQPLVFKTLIMIFNLINDDQKKYSGFRNVVDVYLNKNFSITLAYRPLLRLFINNLHQVIDRFSYTTKERKTNSISSLSSNGSMLIGTCFSDSDLISMLKTVDYIFKFAFKSRELYSNYKTIHAQRDTKDPFLNDINEIFRLCAEIIRLQTPALKSSSSNSILRCDNQLPDLEKIQSHIVKYMINVLSILLESKRFSIEAIARYYNEFLSSSYCLQFKFLSKLIRSKLFEIAESRRVMIEPLCKALSNYLSFSSNESKMRDNAEFFMELMDILERKDIGDLTFELKELSKLLVKLMICFIWLKEKNPTRQLYATIIISFLRIMNSQHFDLLFKSTSRSHYRSSPQIISDLKMRSTQSLDSTYIFQEDYSANLLELLLDFCKDILETNVYPRDWSDLLVVRNSVILKALNNVARYISDCELNEFNEVQKQIWFDYFESMVTLITDPCLQLEKFTLNKQKLILNLYGDMRVDGACELKNMWFALGNKKHYFIPNLIDSFMKVALIPIQKINEEMIPLFFDMINCEYYSCSFFSSDLDNFTKLIVPNQLITILDKHLESGFGDNKFRDTFKNILQEYFIEHEFFKNSMHFVYQAVELFDLLVEYRDIKENDSSNELKTFYMNEIMNFYSRVKRDDLYLKYVKYLREFHKKSNNLVCAAHTLKLHAVKLNWGSDEIVEDYLRHPLYANVISHRELKERLLIEIIEDFNNGQAWEHAYEFSKLLRDRYDTQYEIEKLHDILVKQAEFCKNIMNVERYYCNFFLVGFYGRDFPRLLRNRQFVFKSDQLENIGTFRPRIESWFSKSVRINHSNPPSEAELNAQAKYIQVIKLDPIYEPKDKFINLHIAQKFLKYYQNNEVSKFKHTYRKDTKLNEEDATLWWLKEKIVHIKCPLPNVINFYPIDSENIILNDISPVRSAINNVSEQFEKLKLNIDSIKQTKKITDDHRRLIQGTVDAGVNGGLPKYQKFLTEAYLNANPDSMDTIDELKNLIYETIELAEKYLYLCNKYSSPSDALIINLESEQLPKLKEKFSIPYQKLCKNSCDTPKQNSSSQSSLQTQLSDSTPCKVKLSSALDLSKTIATPKLNGHLKLQSSNRESLSSIRSNSDEDVKQKYIILDEPLNPKRPLRPNRVNSSTNNSSGSNQSSRPISHISDDGSASLSILPNSTIDLANESKDDLTSSVLNTPPPKPPRSNKKLLSTIKLNNNHSEEDINNVQSSPKSVVFRNNL